MVVDGSLFVIGGLWGLLVVFEVVDCYDLVMCCFSCIGSMYMGCMFYMVMCLVDGCVFVFGGMVGLSSGGFVEFIDLVSGVVEVVGWLVCLCIWYVIVVLDDGCVLVVGGY